MKSETTNVTLKVFDVPGHEAATLVDEYRNAETYSATFNSCHLKLSREIPSGIYFYRLNAGNYTATKKLVLMKLFHMT